MNKKLLLRAVKKCKSQSKLANRLEVSRQFVSQMVKGLRPVPLDIVEDLKRILSGE